MWGVGVNELLLQCWGPVSCGGVMSVQSHPMRFLGWSLTCHSPWGAPRRWLGEELGPRITTTNSMDTVDSWAPERLPCIWWALCVKLASLACSLALTSCLLQCLNHQLSQSNWLFPDFAWDLAQAYVMLWYTHAWKPNLERKSTSNWMPVPCNILFVLIAVIMKDSICILVSLRVWLQGARMPLSASAPRPARRAVPWRQALQPFLWAGMKSFFTDWSEAQTEKLERHCFTPSSCSAWTVPGHFK